MDRNEILFLFAFDALTILLNQPVVPESMILAYQTAYISVFLWIAFVLAAPLFDEIFFRGFLFEGFMYSFANLVATVQAALKFCLIPDETLNYLRL